MKNFLIALVLLKVGFLLGIIATLYFTKSKLMIDVGIVKDAEDETENEQD